MRLNSDRSPCDEDGYLMAGKKLWEFNTGNLLVSSPITYMVGGKQYIAMPSGGVMIGFALPE